MFGLIDILWITVGINSRAQGIQEIYLIHRELWIMWRKALINR